MPSLLTIDTVLHPCSIGLSSAQGETHLFENEPNRQTECLMLLIEKILSDAGIRYNDLDAIAVTIGPGGFTGVRTGIAAAKGIHLVHPSIRLIAVTGFEVVATKALAEGSTLPVLATLDARRGQLFCQRFDATGQPLTAPALLTYAEATQLVPDEPCLLAGNGQILLQNSLPALTPLCHPTPSTMQCDAQNIFPIAQKKLSESTSQISLSPLYIRPPDAKIPSPKKN